MATLDNRHFWIAAQLQKGFDVFDLNLVSAYLLTEEVFPVLSQFLRENGCGALATPSGGLSST